MMAICRVCGELFERPHPSTMLCSPRCVYISGKLGTVTGKRLGRERAIEHYGTLWDDPLRLYRHSKYEPVIAAIYKMCVARGTNRFTGDDLRSAGIRVPMRQIGIINKRFGIFERDVSASPIVWSMCISEG